MIPEVNATASWEGTGLIEDLQYWIAHPEDNFGWFIQGDETYAQNARGYYSMDNTLTDFRPQLTINYSTVPEPLHFGLLLATTCLTFQLFKRNRT